MIKSLLAKPLTIQDLAQEIGSRAETAMVMVKLADGTKKVFFSGTDEEYTKAEELFKDVAWVYRIEKENK